MKNFLIVLAIVVLLAAGGLTRWACNVVVNSGKGVVEQTLTPENVIFNYEYFHDQYQAYIKLNNMLETAIEQEDNFLKISGDVISKWTDAEVFEWQRLQSHITGIKNQIDECASKYNAASSKLNVKIFKDKNLPYRLGEN
jgi:primase-polymerase (primpol)-like protein